MEGLCPHGKHIGAVCVPCAEDEIIGAQWDENNMYIDGSKIFADYSANSGLDANYYHIPKTVLRKEDLMDFIEWLEDGGMPSGMMNILKSIVREYNPIAQKETSPLYEAEKRYYFADRHLQNVRRKQEIRRRLPDDAKVNGSESKR